MLEYDPFSEEVMDDPYPVYKRLRDEAPAYHIEKYDAWAISRFKDIWDLSSDPRFSTAQGTTASHLLTKVQPVTPMLNLMDQPDHTALRTKVRPFLAPSAVRGLEPVMRKIFGECLDEAIEKGEADALSDLSQKLSVKVACMAIGIPLEDGDYMNELVWRFFAREPGVDGMTEDGLQAAIDLGAYFMELIAKRRKSGTEADDIVNMFLDFELNGRKFTDEELGSHFSMLIIGGAETFPKTFATGALRLWEHKDQRAEVAKDPSKIPGAYNEMLRFDMPTQFLGRTLLDDVELHGQTLRKGNPVLFLYPAANHDEREFDDPDVFDVKRKPTRILSFGAGIHACIGLHIARMEGKVTFEELLARAPEYEVDIDRSVRLKTEFVQGYTTLPILFR